MLHSFRELSKDWLITKKLGMMFSKTYAKYISGVEIPWRLASQIRLWSEQAGERRLKSSRPVISPRDQSPAAAASLVLRFRA
ncbi:hypothetical protein [Lysinibacillus xylanilyticus]|uniref:hypothetical protein n=1 Tax=Lysinibacillus xylanilyticus TaxID=582475 RepID=UPI0037FD8BCC